MRLLIAVVLVLSVLSEHTRGQEFESKTGKIKGSQVTAPNDKKVNIYLGIPYAEPPIGDLRFAPPKAKAPWTDVFDATKEPPFCTQIKATSFDMAKGFDAKKELGDVKVSGGALQMGFEIEAKKGDSEDCLTLNMYVPDGAKGLPIMVWIHGGAFYAGGSTIPTFDGRVLASQGDVIVINIQVSFIYFKKRI